MKSPVRIPQLLDASTDASLRTLLQVVRELLRLEQVIHGLLEPPLKHHCRVANLRDGMLLLITDSPVWATRLRYRMPELLDRLQTAAGVCFVRCDVKVKLTSTESETRSQARPDLSARTTALLRGVAAHCEEGALRAALLRLSGRE